MRVSDAHQGFFDIQFAMIVADFSLLQVADMPVAQGLIIFVQTTQPVVMNQIVSFGIFAFHQQIDHFVVGGLDVVNFPDGGWFSGVQGVVVQTNQFFLSRTVDHGAQMSVTQRQGFVPVFGVVVVPQKVFLVFGGFQAEAAKGCQQAQKIAKFSHTYCVKCCRIFVAANVIKRHQIIKMSCADDNQSLGPISCMGFLSGAL